MIVAKMKYYNIARLLSSFLGYLISESVGPQQLSDLQTQLTTTQTALQTQDPTQLASLTREDILGDMFHAGVLGYFAEYNALGHIMALQQRAGHTLAMGYGSYGYEPNVSYFFGIPRAIQPGGVVMNVRLGNYVTSHTNDPQARIQLNQQLGILSSTLEHVIPERMHKTPDSQNEGVSTARLLAKAHQAGQRIYHITQQNVAAVLPNIHHDFSTMEEIRNALAVGKEVTTHTDPVSVPGYTGAGYIIIDPDTGIGAYKIGGGMNGSSFDPAVSMYETFFEIFFWMYESVKWIAKVAAIINVLNWLDGVSKLVKGCDGTVLTALAVVAYSAVVLLFTLVLFLPGLGVMAALMWGLAGVWISAMLHSIILDAYCLLEYGRRYKMKVSVEVLDA